MRLHPDSYNTDEDFREELKKAVIKDKGYRVSPDPDQPNLWLWRNGSSGSDVSFNSEQEAWNDLLDSKFED